MIKLTILGVGCHRHQMLRNNLLDALKAFHFEVCLEEVFEIEKFINYSISGTPSLLINDQLVIENRVPGIPELQRMLRRHLKKAPLESKKTSL